MTSKERVLKALRKIDGNPDRVPVQFDLFRQPTEEFGMHMKPGPLYVEVVKCPPENAGTASDIQNHRFPDANAPGRFDEARRDIDRFGVEYFVPGDFELSLFEMSWHLTGLEKYRLGILCDEPWIEHLNDRVEEWSTGLAINLARGPGLTLSGPERTLEASPPPLFLLTIGGQGPGRGIKE